MRNTRISLYAGERHVVLIVFMMTFLFAAGHAHAASLFFEQSGGGVPVNQASELGLFLDTENEEVNAIEGVVLFPSGILELDEIRDGNSIVNLWVERPRVYETAEDSDGEKIFFSGIIPGGYAGSGGLIFSMDVRALEEREVVFEIREASTLLNDGKGTEAPLTTPPYSFRASSAAVTSSDTSYSDTDMPEPFELIVATDASTFGGRYFLVFATQDKGSGMDHYEVREGAGSFVPTESPYLLRNQEMDGEIAVKAIDKSGNEREVSLPPPKPVIWYEKYWKSIILMGVSFAFLAWYVLRKYFRKNVA